MIQPQNFILRECPHCGLPVRWEIVPHLGRWTPYHPDNGCVMHMCLGALHIAPEPRLLKAFADSWNKRQSDIRILSFTPPSDEKVDLACKLVDESIVTVGKAASLADMPYWMLEDELRKRGIRWKE